MDHFDEKEIAKKIHDRNDNVINDLDYIIRKEAERRLHIKRKRRQKNYYVFDWVNDVCLFFGTVWLLGMLI